MTGLSKNISTGDFLGTTDNFSSVPNRLFNINTSTGAATVIGGLVCVGGTSPSVPVGATVTDISDIERDFSTTSTGDYYALSGDKRIVKINGTSGQVTYLPPLASSISGLKGLTISCGNGLLYVINPTLSVIPGQYGAVWQIDKVTGATIAGPLSYGSTNPSWMSTDFGLHFDCCGDYFMGANSLGPVMTVSRPAAGFFAFIGAGTGSTAVRSTYDFARY
jgi:hypothetical protein